MDKKKLGLINKSKLELRKTVGGGTVKQSFSHGRVKSVAVEVKKVRTFDKNSSSQTSNTIGNVDFFDSNGEFKKDSNHKSYNFVFRCIFFFECNLNPKRGFL